MMDRDFCWVGLCSRESSDSVAECSVEVPEPVVGEGKVARRDSILCPESTEC